MNDQLVISGGTRLMYSPMIGGRILSFSHDGYEFLAGKEIHPENFGSTFWSSPQSYWGWPPPPALDSGPYAIVQNGSTKVLCSETDPVTGFRFRKQFSAGKNGRIDLEYSIVNASDEVRQAAPWEITRVRKSGLLVFPLGKGSIGRKQFDPVKADVIDGIVWYRDSNERPANHLLSIADGAEGWMAYVIDGRALIKIFQDSPPERQAPGEAEVLFYASSEADYIEIEIQGTYDTIRPGEESAWKLSWACATVPAALPVAAGSRDLVEFVRTQAGIVR